MELEVIVEDQNKNGDQAASPAPHDDLCCLTKWYFITAKTYAREDIGLAQTVTGLPRQFLETIAEAPLEKIEEISANIRVLPFTPRLSSPLLMKLLENPSDVADAAIIHGLDGGGAHA